MSITDLEAFLRHRLEQPLPGAAAHWRFAPKPIRKGWTPDQQPAGARQAAALILIYPGAGGLWVPLTVRHAGLPHHPGQISLPGGAVDPGESIAEAAVREAHEEIGVDPDAVRVIGPLSPLWVLVSNFVLTPVVAVTDARPIFEAAPHEVEEVLEVPVSALHDRGRIRRTTQNRDGLLVEYPYFDFDPHHVWGATAMVLGEFGSLWHADFGPP